MGTSIFHFPPRCETSEQKSPDFRPFSPLGFHFFFLIHYFIYRLNYYYYFTEGVGTAISRPAKPGFAGGLGASRSFAEPPGEEGGTGRLQGVPTASLPRLPRFGEETLGFGAQLESVSGCFAPIDTLGRGENCVKAAVRAHWGCSPIYSFLRDSLN